MIERPYLVIEVRVGHDGEHLAACTCRWLQQQIGKKLADSTARYYLALSGGSTPQRLYALLAELPADQIDWTGVVLIWGDERNVPPDHADSNFRMVQQTLLSKIEIPPENILGVPNPGGPAEQAAAEYEQRLRAVLPCDASGRWPRLDCVLLGLGDDAHTASLFPQTAALQEQDRWCVANFVPKLNTWRITLTAPAINAAANVAFLIAGEKKTDALRALWHGPAAPDLVPSQLIRPTDGVLWFFVDSAALDGVDPPVAPRRCEG
ncbi:MAG: 6-phosphogluconolactonase [Planctomycetota bacterium]|nr:MAG: 6-phosphogluconolactonase [Planctomycetota bacterium]